MKSAILAIVCVSLCMGCERPPPALQKPFTLALSYELDTLDPHHRNSVSNFALMSHFYEPLVATNPSMAIIPCLAARWENPDLSTWIFYLREGVRFHDGKPLEAKDVVYSFQRLLSSQDLEMSGYLQDLVEAKALNDHTVKLRTNLPMSILLNKVRFILIIPKDSGDKVKLGTNGTGPYTLTSWILNKSIELTRNENYWGPKPSLQYVSIRLNRSPEQAMKELLVGEAQFVQCNSKDSKQKLGSDPRFTLHHNDSLFLKYLGYDLSRDVTPFCSVQPNPFKNKLVRQAIHLAIDRRRLVMELPTYAVPANQPLPPFIFGYNPAIPAARHDLQEARRLLKAAGLPDGFDVTLHVRKLFEQAGTLVKEHLALAGIRVHLQVLPDTEILPGLRKHQYTFFLSRIGSPTGDASDVTDNCLHSLDAARRYGFMNYGEYFNPEVDRAIEESGRIQQLERRRNLIQSVMKTVMEDVVWVPLYIDQDVFAIDKRYSWKPRNDSFVFVSEIKTGVKQ